MCLKNLDLHVKRAVPVLDRELMLILIFLSSFLVLWQDPSNWKTNFSAFHPESAEPFLNPLLPLSSVIKEQHDQTLECALAWGKNSGSLVYKLFPWERTLGPNRYLQILKVLCWSPAVPCQEKAFSEELCPSLYLFSSVSLICPTLGQIICNRKFSRRKYSLLLGV